MEREPGDFWAHLIDDVLSAEFPGEHVDLDEEKSWVDVLTKNIQISMISQEIYGGVLDGPTNSGLTEPNTYIYIYYSIKLI